MVRLSNGVVGFVNIVTLLGSLACLGSSLWFYTHHGARGGAGTTVCQEVLQRPLLILGLCLFVVSLIGLIGSCGRIRSLLRIYLLLLVVLVIGLVGFTAFTVAVTNRGVGEAVSGRGYKEYRLGDYSHWLQKYVVNQKNWGKIRACLVDANVCDINFSPGGATESAQDFFKKSLSPTQFGCCKPPTHCGFEFKNSTFWTVPKGSVSQVDADCTAWSNDQRVLCYDCKSCKAGVLDNIKRQWRLLTLVDLLILVLALVLITVGCCALKNDRSSQYRSGYP